MRELKYPAAPVFLLLFSVSGPLFSQQTCPELLPGRNGPAAAALRSAAPYGAIPAAVPVPGPVPAGHQGLYPVPERTFLDRAFNYSGYIVAAYNTIKAKIEDSGILPGVSAAPTFEETSKQVIAAVKNSALPPRRAGEPTLLANPAWLLEMERLSGARFLAGNTARFLIDGEASFAMKDSLIKNAKKRIYIGSYSFHDDITGFETADMLIAKKREGVEVKVVLDHKVIYTSGTKAVKRMKDAGVEVLRYIDKQRTGDYWHTKLLLVDDRYAIVGGMNYSDLYSHKDPDGPKWRDTDVLYTGPAAAETRRIFAGIWNAEVEKKKLPLGRIGEALPGAGRPAGDARIAVLFQDPPYSSPAILLNIVKAVYGATRRINIENPYYVAVPAITQALLEARDRGVEVNILTNSKDSIDAEAKPMADIIIKGLLPLVPAGVNVYLKKGETLHSKFMTVDGVYCSIGSYNFHPRSERYDTEMNVGILDPVSIAGLDAEFEKDLAAADRIRTVDDLEYEPGWLSRIVGRYFYAELSGKGAVK